MVKANNLLVAGLTCIRSKPSPEEIVFVDILEISSSRRGKLPDPIRREIYQRLQCTKKFSPSLRTLPYLRSRVTSEDSFGKAQPWTTGLFGGISGTRSRVKLAKIMDLGKISGIRDASEGVEMWFSIQPIVSSFR